MIRGGVQSVMLMVVLGSVATCALMVTTVLGSSDEDFRRNFLDDKYDKTFTNNNQTKVTRSFLARILSYSFLQILLLTSQTELGKVIGEILSKATGTSYWDNPFQVEL